MVSDCIFNGQKIKCEIPKCTTLLNACKYMKNIHHIYKIFIMYSHNCIFNKQGATGELWLWRCHLSVIKQINQWKWTAWSPECFYWDRNHWIFSLFVPFQSCLLSNINLSEVHLTALSHGNKIQPFFTAIYCGVRKGTCKEREKLGLGAASRTEVLHDKNQWQERFTKSSHQSSLQKGKSFLYQCLCLIFPHSDAFPLVLHLLLLPFALSLTWALTTGKFLFKTPLRFIGKYFRNKVQGFLGVNHLIFRTILSF